MFRLHRELWQELHQAVGAARDAADQLGDALNVLDTRLGRILARPEAVPDELRPRAPWQRADRSRSRSPRLRRPELDLPDGDHRAVEVVEPSEDSTPFLWDPPFQVHSGPRSRRTYDFAYLQRLVSCIMSTPELLAEAHGHFVSDAMAGNSMAPRPSLLCRDEPISMEQPTILAVASHFQRLGDDVAIKVNAMVKRHGCCWSEGKWTFGLGNPTRPPPTLGTADAHLPTMRGDPWMMSDPWASSSAASSKDAGRRDLGQAQVHNIAEDDDATDFEKGNQSQDQVCLRHRQGVGAGTEMEYRRPEAFCCPNHPQA